MHLSEFILHFAWKQLIIVLFTHVHARQVAHFLKSFISLAKVVSRFLSTFIDRVNRVSHHLLAEQSLVRSIDPQLASKHFVRVAQSIERQSDPVVVWIELNKFFLRLKYLQSVLQIFNRFGQVRDVLSFIFKVLLVLL